MTVIMAATLMALHSGQKETKYHLLNSLLLADLIERTNKAELILERKRFFIALSHAHFSFSHAHFSLWGPKMKRACEKAMEKKKPLALLVWIQLKGPTNLVFPYDICNLHETVVAVWLPFRGRSLSTRYQVWVEGQSQSSFSSLDSNELRLVNYEVVPPNNSVDSYKNTTFTQIYLIDNQC